MHFAKAKRTPYYLKLTSDIPLIIQDGFDLTLEMKPHFDGKGRLLSLDLVHHTAGFLYSHLFYCDDIIKEGSPCGGIFNEQLCLSEIAQAFFIGGVRTPSHGENILTALECGLCVYHGFHSFKACKVEPCSLFVVVSFRKRGGDP